MIRRVPDPSPGEAAAAPGPELPGAAVGDDMVDRPAVTERPAYGPPGPVGGAVDDEGPLGRADEHGRAPARADARASRAAVVARAARASRGVGLAVRHGDLPSRVVQSAPGDTGPQQMPRTGSWVRSDDSSAVTADRCAGLDYGRRLQDKNPQHDRWTHHHGPIRSGGRGDRYECPAATSAVGRASPAAIRRAHTPSAALPAAAASAAGLPAAVCSAAASAACCVPAAVPSAAALPAAGDECRRPAG